MLTIQDVADVFRVRYLTVWKAIQEKKIKVVRVGRAYRISEEELERLKKEGF